MLELLESNASPQEKARFLSIAKVSGRLMLSLINDMLDFSMIINKKFIKKLASFDLASAVNEAADLLRFQIAEKGLELSISLCHRLPTRIFTDADRLKQLILNLLSNAYKYTRRGSISVRVTGLREDILNED